MTHLGSWLSALADGQLPADETERTLAHVATCPRCAAELAAARAAHRALAAAEPVEPAPDLTARLLSLAPAGAPALGPHPDPFVPTTPLPGRSSGVFPGRSRGALRGDVAGGGRLASRVLLGSVAGIGVVAVSLFSLGARPAVVPSDHPGLALRVLAQASASVPAADSSDSDTTRLASDGWTVPQLPSGWTVTATHQESGGVEVDLTGPTTTAVVSERPGRLDAAALTGLPTQQVDGREVYLLSSEPWHVAWQADDDVVEVLAPTTDGSVAALVAAFPAAPYDDGVPARIGRGWSVVTRALQTR